MLHIDFTRAFFILGQLMNIFVWTACDVPPLDSTSLQHQPLTLQSARLQSTIAKRLARPGLVKAIMGALLYLDDQQIRERSGWHSPTVDACSGDGCFPTLPGAGKGLPLPFPLIKNVQGEWANFIHPLPEKLSFLNDQGDSIIQLQDSNLFMTAAVLYPLYLFDESGLPIKQRVIREMRQLAFENIEQFRRQTAYNFWIELPGTTSSAARVGPINLPTLQMQLIRLVAVVPDDLWPQPVPQRQWFLDALDRKTNPYGIDAFANIPNDADDTAVATVSAVLHQRFDQGKAVDFGPLEELLKWRDVQRLKEDGRDAWKGKDTGAFLTWIKDELAPPFLTPETGVIPLGVNNVDCVVNANVLLALGLTQSLGKKGAAEAAKLMRLAVEKKAWEGCGLYYPQRMIFPYAITRAFRDGGANFPDLRQAMKTLLLQLLEEQDQLTATSKALRGAFPGGPDVTTDLSTALGLSALLNIGEALAEETGVKARYRRAIEEALAYLLSRERPHWIKFADTFNRQGDRPTWPWDRGSRWEAGVYFAASAQSWAHWKGEAYTVAMVLEALTKYALAYDLGQSTITKGRKMRVKQYARSASKAEKEFQFEIW